MRRVSFVLLVALGLSLIVSHAIGGFPIGAVILAMVGFGIYCAVGGLIVFRRDGHLTGWLLLLVGVLLLLGDSGYSPWLSDTTKAWIGSWVWTAVFAVFAAMTLTFPSGHAPEGDGIWAHVGRLALPVLPVLVVAATLTTELGGPEMASSTTNIWGFLPSWMSTPLLFGVVAILVGGSISLLVKRRKARGAERAQLTWVVFGLMLLGSSILLTFAYISGSVALGAGDPGDSAWTVTWLTMVTFPVWFGIAILRYRLFDIDRIVSRTVSYSLLVVLLALVFGIAVTGLTSLLPANSSLSVAASTLVVASLFNPVRRRMQNLVDRRFNRSQYDAIRLGSRFADTMRDEVDPDAIVRGWVGVVSDTVQPATMSVWIKEGA